MLVSILQGILLGFSVAWPPGPINAIILEQGIENKFKQAFFVGIGACSGDFIWALFVISGIGFVSDSQTVKIILSIISGILLLYLAITYLIKAYQSYKNQSLLKVGKQNRRGFLLGFSLALSSPWNISFWIAVIGQNATDGVAVIKALIFAFSVLLGALLWILIYLGAIRIGARFANLWWRIVTQAFTGLLMLFFLIRLIYKFSQLN